jgi:hypothetical protein
MIQITQSKKLQLAWPAARANNVTVNCASVDRSGYAYAVIRVAIGVTDAGFTALKLQESDDNSTFTDVPGTDFSVSPLALPASTNGNTLWEFQVDLRGGRKRYLKPLVTIGNGSLGAFVAVGAELFRAEQTPITSAGQGLAGFVTV